MHEQVGGHHVVESVTLEASPRFLTSAGHYGCLLMAGLDASDTIEADVHLVAGVTEALKMLTARAYAADGYSFELSPLSVAPLATVSIRVPQSCPSVAHHHLSFPSTSVCSIVGPWCG